MHPQIQNMLRAVALEEKEQQERFRLDQQHSLKSLKAEGLALHPIRVTGKGFGYAEYPEIRFRLPFPAETQLFRDGSAIECFCADEEPVKGILLNLEGNMGEFRLFAPDFPDWIEDQGVGIKLSPDTRTTEIMKDSLQNLEKDKRLSRLFLEIHGEAEATTATVPGTAELPVFHNRKLNESQQIAVRAVLANEHILIVHGPPGTGKTTTLVEAIRQLADEGKKVLVSAPSNTAVDHISLGLVRGGLKVLRVGNIGKIDPELYGHTPEGRLKDSGHQKDIKALKVRAEEFRRMALKYKRNFGKAEREQRKLLFQEVKSIRDEIRKMRAYEEDKLFREAQVITGTPIGLRDAGLKSMHFDTLVIDEAGQCLEPLAWVIFPFAEKIVLAGDPYQLPPTVLGTEAAKLGLNRSILEAAIHHLPEVHLLDTQYRMRASIAGFSSAWFYENLLRTAVHLEDQGVHIHFIDTAGTGMEESQGPEGSSLQNEGELDIIQKLIDQEGLDPTTTAFISPYAGQVAVAKDSLPSEMRIRTIDSFQGQEAPVVIVSLVRSNADGDIGFLKDYRRMNVAMTRAKEKLYLVGDSATIGRDPFYQAMITYIEEKGQYRSAWELMH
jgi:superfamily I DNA and/or RNA helicase